MKHGETAAAAEVGDRGGAAAEVVDAPGDRPARLEPEVARAVEPHPLVRGRPQDRLGVRVVGRRDRRHDHVEGEALSAGRGGEPGQVGGHAFGLDMAAGPHREVDPAEARRGGGLGERFGVEPLQVLREDPQPAGAGRRRGGPGRRRGGPGRDAGDGDIQAKPAAAFPPGMARDHVGHGLGHGFSSAAA